MLFDGWINELLIALTDIVAKTYACATKLEKTQVLLQSLSSESTKGWKIVVDVLELGFGKLYTNFR